MTIAVKCSRCGVQYEVADSKAGKKGRCPTCGGSIHVPTLGEAGEAYHRSRSDRHASHMMGWIAVSVVAAVLVLAIMLTLRGESPPSEEPLGGRIPPAETRTAPPPTEAKPPAGVAAGPAGAAPAAEPKPVPGADTEKRAFLIRYAKEKLGNYLDLLSNERRLRAREVLRKDRAYEPVSPEEYQLRRSVLEEAATLAAAGEKTDDWRLNEPLTDAERRELEELAERIPTASAEMVDELGRLGLQATQRTDPFGRKLINTDDAEAKLNALQSSLPGT